MLIVIITPSNASNKFYIFANMISVVIIGSGNVAHHLTQAFLKSDSVILKQLYARNTAAFSLFKNDVAITNNITSLEEADVYILAISDDAIADVSSKLKKENFVVHTSGSVSMDTLQHQGKKGIFYPLQSFSKDKAVNFDVIPFCLEADTEEDLQKLEFLAKAIGKKHYRITSEQRSKLHVAAVFVNNFVNHMYKIGNDLCNTYEVPFEVLLPLIEETSAKIASLSPQEAQTGPAIRNDKQTIARHLASLNEQQQEVYKIITKSIQNG